MEIKVLGPGCARCSFGFFSITHNKVQIPVGPAARDAWKQNNSFPLPFRRLGLQPVWKR